MVVLEAETPKAFGDSFEARSLRLMGKGCFSRQAFSCRKNGPSAALTHRAVKVEDSAERLHGPSPDKTHAAAECCAALTAFRHGPALG
jgi:hypothetical protein